MLELCWVASVWWSTDRCGRYHLNPIINWTYFSITLSVCPSIISSYLLLYRCLLMVLSGCHSITHTHTRAHALDCSLMLTAARRLHRVCELSTITSDSAPLPVQVNYSLWWAEMEAWMNWPQQHFLCSLADGREALWRGGASAAVYRPPSTQRGRIYGDNDCLRRGLLLWGQCKLSPPENKHIRTHTHTHTSTCVTYLTTN